MKRIWIQRIGAAVLCAVLLAGCMPGGPAADSTASADPLTGQEQQYPGQRPAAVVIDNAPAQELVKANPGLTTLETEYANEKYAIGVAKGNTALLDAVNGALKELMEDGTIQSIIDKYIPADAGSAEAE